MLGERLVDLGKTSVGLEKVEFVHLGKNIALSFVFWGPTLGVIHNCSPSGLFSSGEGGLGIFTKRSDISILVTFSSGRFRSRRVLKNLKNRNV